jgi:hypothetical protein
LGKKEKKTPTNSAHQQKENFRETVEVAAAAKNEVLNLG